MQNVPLHERHRIQIAPKDGSGGTSWATNLSRAKLVISGSCRRIQDCKMAHFRSGFWRAGAISKRFVTVSLIEEGHEMDLSDPLFKCILLRPLCGPRYILQHPFGTKQSYETRIKKVFHTNRRTNWHVTASERLLVVIRNVGRTNRIQLTYETQVS